MRSSGRRRVRGLLGLATVLALAGGTLVATGASAAASGRPAGLDRGLSTSGHHSVSVVVSGKDGADGLVTAAVRAAGGTHVRALPIVHGAAAAVPADHLAALARAAGVTAVTANRQIKLAGNGWDASVSASPYAWTSQATSTWAQTGNKGAGIGVAVLDTGVSDVGDLTGRVMHGPDFSGENNNSVDSFGHGTVMAGIIGGSGLANGAGHPLTGVAPSANIIAVKAAGRNGATDVSTILTAMTWIGAFKDTYNIRVLNLSWGVPSTQDPIIDPLNYAVEQLWAMGVTVIAAAGNSGPNAGTILKPGDDPLVVTVGAYDDKGDSNTLNDTIPAWSSQGPTAQGRMKPDLVAPGRTIVATRSPGSAIELANPQALVGSAYIKGSGTSEATAVTSGAAALLLAAHPNWTPDQVKFALTASASRIANVPSTLQGAGRLQIKAAANTPVGLVIPQLPIAVGGGSLDASRGSAALLTTSCGDVTWLLTDDRGNYCGQWTDPTYTGNAWTGNAWTGNAWTGNAWTTVGYTGNAWTGNAWTGSTWSSNAWTGNAWTGNAWTGNAWTGNAWTSTTWTGNAWTGNAWTGNAWTGNAWTGNAWTGNAWTSNDYDGTQANTPTAADGSSGGAFSGGFLTAFYGDQPKYGRIIPGEVSALLPVTIPGLG
ncbi:MAG: aprX [Frankiales bacterium]|nr:aprX [Frankiales bacterium]